MVENVADERSKLIWKLGDLMEQNADEIAQIESLDNGKPIRDSRNVDVPGSYEMLRYMAGWATRLTGETIPVSAPGNWHAIRCASRSAWSARSSRGISR